jgi:hypothetical protein
MTVSRPLRRVARATDAEAIAHLHAESWRRTYRGMMSDEFLDGRALENRRRVWRQRLQTLGGSQYVCVAEDGPADRGHASRIDQLAADIAHLDRKLTCAGRPP